jgi:hypothetical protein
LPPLALESRNAPPPVEGREKSSTGFPGIQAGFKPRSQVWIATGSLNTFSVTAASKPSGA